MSSRNACDLGVLEDAQARRQSFTTWGILALAVFVSVGLAEWSKRSAMGEKVVSAQVLERALTIAEKMGDRRSSQPQHAGGWTTASRSEMGISDAGKNLSDLGVSAVKPAAAAAVNVKVNVNESLGNGSRVAGGGLPATSNPKHATLRSESVATMQTSAGGEK